MTAKRTPENERIKRRYLQFLKEVKGRDEASLDAVAKALERFDFDNRRRDFRKFHVEQAMAFKAHLADQVNIRTGAPLSASTVNSTLAALKSFFVWLADQARAFATPTPSISTRRTILSVSRLRIDTSLVRH